MLNFPTQTCYIFIDHQGHLRQVLAEIRKKNFSINSITIYTTKLFVVELKKRTLKIASKFFPPVGCLLIHVQFQRMPARAHLPQDSMERSLCQMKCKNKTAPDHVRKIGVGNVPNILVK